MKQEFKIEDMYQSYLQRSGLQEQQMGQVQRSEMRRCFFAGVGSMLLTMRDQVSRLDEEEGIKVLDDMTDQVTRFFLSEATRQN